MFGKAGGGLNVLCQEEARITDRKRMKKERTREICFKY